MVDRSENKVVQYKDIKKMLLIKITSLRLLLCDIAHIWGIFSTLLWPTQQYSIVLKSTQYFSFLLQFSFSLPYFQFAYCPGCPLNFPDKSERPVPTSSFYIGNNPLEKKKSGSRENLFHYTRENVYKTVQVEICIIYAV